MNYLDNYNKWLNYKDLDLELKEEMLKMSENDKKEAFTLDLEFGTGGLRGIIGAGTNRLNIYTIAKTTNGFVKYLLDKYKDNTVVISYDNRNKSKSFALLCAQIIASYDINVYLYDKLMPTPLLSYAVRNLKATGGIMITASHNPKVYNGFKVYDHEGCQLLPEDADIIIKNIKDIKDEFNYNVAVKSPLIKLVPQSVIDSYLKDISVLELNKDLNKTIKTVFSPLHGTASSIIEDVYKYFNYELYPVLKEMEERSDFGDLNYPNPEDKAVYSEGLKLANKINADLVITTDPDADRVGVLVLDKGIPYYLDGNETATLMFNYLVTRLKELNMLKDNSYLFQTLVSSFLPIEIAKANNIKYDLVLTGFKYIGNKIKDIKEKNYNFLFGFEESYGSLLLDVCRDKDAIMASVFITSMANYYKEKFNKSLVCVLEDIYKTYGYYKNDIITITIPGLDGLEKMAKCIKKLREDNISLNDFKIIEKEDYLTLTKYSYLDNKTSALDFTKSDVLKFNLENDLYFIVRKSGTEPKLKIYIGAKHKNKEELENNIKSLKEELEILINSFLA